MYVGHLVASTSRRPEDDVRCSFLHCTEAHFWAELTQSAIDAARNALCDIECPHIEMILIRPSLLDIACTVTHI